MVRKSDVILLVKETLEEHIPSFVDVDDAAEDLAARLSDVFEIYNDEPEDDEVEEEIAAEPDED